MDVHYRYIRQRSDDVFELCLHGYGSESNGKVGFRCISPKVYMILSGHCSLSWFTGLIYLVLNQTYLSLTKSSEKYVNIYKT